MCRYVNWNGRDVSSELLLAFIVCSQSFHSMQSIISRSVYFRVMEEGQHFESLCKGNCEEEFWLSSSQNELVVCRGPNELRNILVKFNASSTIVADDPSFLPCPQTLLQAMADRGRFTTDEYCNPDAEEHCVRYHYKATHCFRSNTPR